MVVFCVFKSMYVEYTATKMNWYDVYMLSQPTIQSLIKIIREEYGRDLNMKEATEVANNLVGFFNLLANIHHKNEEESKNSKSIQRQETPSP